ncbi:MAG: glycosyltransferase, partial [Chitinophagaceae bacterium]
PLGKWSENFLRKRNYRYIKKFSSCWVPDHAGENNLAGALSHPGEKPVVPVQYIGPLSRFDSFSPLRDGDKNHLLFILSGPEPQRSILENKIVKEVSHYHGTATIVRGLPGSSSLIPSSNMIQFYNHLPADELKKEILQAAFVISRCGYSTVMDLAVLQKKSILIPTPGQPEQEYLAKYLQQKQFAFCIPQNKFNLSDILSTANQFEYKFFVFNGEKMLPPVISDFIATLGKNNYGNR